MSTTGALLLFGWRKVKGSFVRGTRERVSGWLESATSEASWWVWEREVEPGPREKDKMQGCLHSCSVYTQKCSLHS